MFTKDIFSVDTLTIVLKSS